MYKKANSPPAWWNQNKARLQTEFGLRPEIVAMLNNFNQIVWDSAPPPSNPNAVAYVTNEDKNNDGKIDKIHFVLPKFPANPTEEEMNEILGQVAATLVHEYAHIEDFNKNLETDDFPGGEGVAEQAEQAYKSTLEQRLKQMAPANSNSYPEGMSTAAKLEIAKHLVKLANHLDHNGYKKISDEIDSIVKKIAAHGNEDYMSEFHAKSIENSAEEIIEDLEEGKELDPWQKSYLAQADVMIDNVQERLDQEEKINSMANALDKLFKY